MSGLNEKHVFICNTNAHTHTTCTDSLQLEVDREICAGQTKIDSVDYDYKIQRTFDNDGLVLKLMSFDDNFDAENSLEIDPEKTLVLQVSDAEVSFCCCVCFIKPYKPFTHSNTAQLELLLAYQPGLFLRSLRKWSSQKAICDWLVTRIIIETETVVDGTVVKHLSVDRSVPVPRSIEKGEITVSTPGPATANNKTAAAAPNALPVGYQLRARQFNNDIILEAVPDNNNKNNQGNDDDENDNDATTQEGKEKEKDHFFDRPMSRVKIGLAEFQSLGAPENVPEQEAFPLRPKTNNTTPGNADNSEIFDLGRPARTPLDSLLSRLSWSVKNGQPVLGLNRVVYEETKAIKGVATLLRASVMNKDIIFQATRLESKNVSDENLNKVDGPTSR